MEKFEREVLDRLTRLETKIDLQDYKGLAEKVEEAHSMAKNNEQDIKDLQDRNKYLTRTIATAIIGGIIGLVFILIKIGMGVN